MESKSKIINESQVLLERFNRRDSEAFGEVYSLMYKELFYYTYSFYKETEIDAKDII